MTVKIRLARFGKKGSAFYRVVVANSTDKREGSYIDMLGTYDPHGLDMDTRVKLDLEKVKEWLVKGAVLTDTVKEIVSGRTVLSVPVKKAKKKGRKATGKLVATKKEELKKKEALLKASSDKKLARKKKQEILSKNKPTEKPAEVEAEKTE